MGPSVQKNTLSDDFGHGLSTVVSVLRFRNQFLPTVQTFAVRETNDSRHNGGTTGAPPYAETSVSRTSNVGTVGKNWLLKRVLVLIVGRIFFVYIYIVEFSLGLCSGNLCIHYFRIEGLVSKEVLDCRFAYMPSAICVFNIKN